MIYDQVIYDQNKHELGKAAAFRLALTPEVAAAIIINILAHGELLKPNEFYARLDELLQEYVV